MTRRKFLMQSGQLAAVAFASTWLPRRAFANPLGKPVGIQLYTIREAMDADAPGTLKKLRAIGYGAVETAGFGKRTAKEFRQLLEDNGLVCPSAHLGFDPNNLNAALDDSNALGAKYAASGSLDGLVNAEKPKAWSATRAMSRDEAKRTAELCNRIGEAAKKAGLQYAYHNHAFEFTDLGDGTNTFDLLLHDTDPALVKFEIDCGWMVFAGHDPVAYFNKNPGRIPLIHVKDFLRNADGAPKEMRGAELGRGVVDYKPIFAAAAKAGLQNYFVEQEGPFARMTPMEAAKVGYDYVHGLG
jgi:sugar phosphate isomerase/epimerase